MASTADAVISYPATSRAAASATAQWCLRWSGSASPSGRCRRSSCRIIRGTGWRSGSCPMTGASPGLFRPLVQESGRRGRRGGLRLSRLAGAGRSRRRTRRAVKAARPDAIYLCDPIVGDAAASMSARRSPQPSATRCCRSPTSPSRTPSNAPGLRRAWPDRPIWKRLARSCLPRPCSSRRRRPDARPYRQPARRGTGRCSSSIPR